MATAPRAADETHAGSRDVPVWLRPNVVTVVLVGILVLLAWQHRWTFDDGFINFRVVKQLEAGHGPVYNAGQRVEVYTSPLWLFVLAFADIVTPLRIEWLSVLLGIGFTATGLAASIAASRRLWSGIDERAREVPAGALVIVATAPMWYFATSGLEGGLTFAWLGASLWTLARWATGSRSMSRWGWLLIGAGWLVRPELALLSLTAAAAVVVADASGRSVPRRILATGWAWILPVAYEAFRMGYFASLLPNTAFAKQAGGARWGVGWNYLTQFVGNYWLWLAAAALVVAGYVPLLVRLSRRDRRRFVVIVGWLTGTVLTTLYVVRIGGDYIDARLLLPSFFAFCAPVAVTRVATSARAMAVAVLAAWTLVAGLLLRPSAAYVTIVGDRRPNIVTLSDALSGSSATAYADVESAPYTFELHPLPAAHNPELPPRTAALSGIGILGYALGVHVYVLDLAGLADPVAAHFELPTRGLPGHEKIDPPAWSAARLLAPSASAPPRFFVADALLRPLIPIPDAASFPREIDAVRAALRCGQLDALQRSYEDHLDLHRFLSNIVHSVTYSRVTIPPDPVAAEKKFCPQR